MNVNTDSRLARVRQEEKSSSARLSANIFGHASCYLQIPEKGGTAPATPLRVNVFPVLDATAVPSRKERVNWETATGHRYALRLSESQVIRKRLWQAALALHNCVEINAKKLGGVPTLRGTRFSLAQVFSQIADGDSIGELAESFDLDHDMLAALMHAMAAHLDRPTAR